MKRRLLFIHADDIGKCSGKGRTMSDFLPVSKKDLEKKGITQPDIICVSGDAYVDHPSFGIAIISRGIEAEG